MSEWSTLPPNGKARPAAEGSRPIERRLQVGAVHAQVDRAPHRRALPFGTHHVIPATSHLSRLSCAAIAEGNGYLGLKGHLGLNGGVHDDAGLAARVLVVDDDSVSRHAAVKYLESCNVHAKSAAGRLEMVSQFAKAEPDLVVLDLRPGQGGGLDLLRELRSLSNVPLIVTTGQRADETDRVIALELGADDCLTKPFELRELLARVRAVLRRSKTPRSELKGEPGPRHYLFAGWKLDRHTRRFTSPGGAPVALTKSEFSLLTAFLEAPMRPLSREHLLRATRVHEDVFDRSIDVQVLRLRRKLETDANAPRIIRTERGIGYVFALPVECL